MFGVDQMYQSIRRWYILRTYSTKDRNVSHAGDGQVSKAMVLPRAVIAGFTVRNHFAA